MSYKVQPSIEAMERLYNFISVNRLNANTRIPSERDLCEMWGISRSALRQAIDSLVENGLLYRVRNTGVFVAPSKLIRNMDTVDTLIDQSKQRGIRTAKKILLYRKVDATKQMSRKLKIPLGKPVMEVRLVREFDSLPCALETIFIDITKFPDFENYYNVHTRMGDIFEHVYHKLQSTGEEHISVTYASEEEAIILQVKEGEAVFFTSGLVKDQIGEPIIYYKQLLRADQFKMVSVVHQIRK